MQTVVSQMRGPCSRVSSSHSRPCTRKLPGNRGHCGRNVVRAESRSSQEKLVLEIPNSSQLPWTSVWDRPRTTQSKDTKTLDASRTLHHREHQLDQDLKTAEYFMILSPSADHKNVNKHGVVNHKDRLNYDPRPNANPIQIAITRTRRDQYSSRPTISRCFSSRLLSWSQSLINQFV